MVELVDPVMAGVMVGLIHLTRPTLTQLRRMMEVLEGVARERGRWMMVSSCFLLFCLLFCCELCALD